MPEGRRGYSPDEIKAKDYPQGDEGIHQTPDSPAYARIIANVFGGIVVIRSISLGRGLITPPTPALLRNG